MQVPSVAAQVIISIVPIVGIVMGAFIAFFHLLWSHRERKLLIQQGSWTPRSIDIRMIALLSGLLLVAVGLPLSILLVILAGSSFALLGGFIPLGVGLALLLFVRLYRRPGA